MTEERRLGDLAAPEEPKEAPGALASGIPNVVDLRIVSPEEVLYRAHVQWVQVPLDDGLIGIWPGHGALVGALAPGVILIGEGEMVRELGVRRGILRVTEDRCVVMVSQLAEEGAGVREATGDEGGKDRLFDDLAGTLEETLGEDALRGLQED